MTTNHQHNMKRHSLRRTLFPSLSASIALAIGLLGAVSARAATSTWNGGSGSGDVWTDAANWGGTAAATGDFLIFDGATRLTPSNDFSAGTIFNNIGFSSGASSFTLGGNGITLTNVGNAAGGVTSGGSISNSSPSAQAVGLPVTLTSGKHNFVTDGGGQLNLSGAVTRNTGAVGIFNPASGNINVTGSGMVNANGILGGWATLGNDWAALDASSNVVAYTGYTDISAGLVANGAASNVRFISDTGHIAASNITVNSFLATIGAARNLTNIGTVKLGSNGGIYRTAASSANNVLTVLGGTLTANGGGEITLSDATAGTGFAGTANNLQVTTTVIANDGANPVSVNVMGYIVLSGANSYSGGTCINQGRVQTGSANALGVGPVYVYPGGQAFINNGTTITNAFFISGIGTTESAGLGAIRAAGRNITNVVTLMGDAAIGCGNNGTIANNRITGKITGPGGLIIGNGSNNNGGGTLTVGTAGITNDYAGNTLISSNTARASALAFTAGANNVMPSGSGKGNVILNGAAQTATLDLNGTTQNINGLNSAGTTPANTFVESTVAGGVLVFGNNNVNSSFGGTVRNGAGSLGLTKAGSGTHTFSGPLTYTGNTAVNGGALMLAAGSAVPVSPVISVNSNATLNVSAFCPVTLGAAQALTMSNGTIVVALQPVGNALTTPVLNSLGSTNFVAITDIPAIGSYPAQFVALKYTNTLGGGLNFGLAGSLPPSPGTPYAGYISNNVANGSVDLVVTAGPSSIKWAGYSAGNTNTAWDTTTANWRTSGGSPITYADGTFVNFDNTASNGIVTLAQNVSPADITVSNTSLTYTINDGGSGFYITGASGITKQGSGLLVLDNTGVNDFTGGIFISGGTLQVGTNDTGGNIPATGNVVDNGALNFARTDTVTVSNQISGTGTIAQNGSGTLLLAGANSFTGAVTVAQGTLQVGDNSALGSTNGNTTIASGATLDVNGSAGNTRRLGAERIIVGGSGIGGNGALVNNGSDSFPTVSFVTLTGDTVFGGSGRWDLRVVTGSSVTDAALSTGGNAYNLTKVGANQVSIVNATVDANLADINIQAGTLSVEVNTTGLGNPTRTLNLQSGATLQLFAPTNQLNKQFVIRDGGTVLNSSGANTIIGPMQLTNANATAYCTFNVGGTSLTLNNTITGDATIYKVTGGSPLVIAGNSPGFAGGGLFSAGTVTLTGTLSNALGISLTAGRFNVNGSLLGAGVTTATGSIIAGGGTAAGAIGVSGTLLPGDTGVAGTLTVGGLTLEGSATVTNDLSAFATVGGGTNDLVQVNGNLVVNGGTIVVNALGLLQTGVPYRLFNYTGTLTWNADLSIPNSGPYSFTWSTNTPGQVNLVVSGGPPIWNGGSSVSSLWSDATNWGGITVVPNDFLYFGGTNRLNNTNDATAGTTYSDITFVPSAGAFTLNGTDLTLGGTLLNNSTNAQTVNLGLNLGANRTFNGGTAGLIIGGVVSNTVNLTTNTLAGNGTLTNLLASADPNSITNILNIISNANWSLMDNPAATLVTLPVGIDIAAGTFNYGAAGSAPKLTSPATGGFLRVGITPGAPATFNMVNGTLTVAARLNTGAAAGAIANVNQTGGTINVGLLQVSDSSANAMTTMNVTGGTFNSTDGTVLQGIFLASRGTGVVTVAGSGAINCATLDMSRNAAGNTLGSIGVFNLNGGVLTASRIGAATSASQAGGTPTATFNFNGGTLRAGASSATYYQGNASAPAIPIVSIVKSGGAIIDTTNFNISILEPLQHDAGLGAAPDGGLTKHGAGTLTLTAASTYTGNTVISNGTLVVSGSLGTTAVTVGNNATLAGTGSLGSNVTVNAGGTLSPGNAAVLGVLTVLSNVTINGTAAMDLNKSTATNDVLRAATITYGGTLSLTNLAGTLAATDTFKLFSAASYAGGFTSIVPAVPDVGLAWNTNTLTTDGILRLTATVNTTPTNLMSSTSGGNLTLTWPGDHIGWTLQVQTNSRAVGLNTNWFSVTGSAATNQVAVAIDPATPTVFYRLVYP